jgi:hypothetical protein
MKYVAPTAPLPIGGVLDNWMRLFRASLGACWALALIVAIAGAVFELTVTPTLPSRGATALQNYMNYWSSFRGPTTLLAYIAMGLVTLLVHGAVLAQQSALVRGGETFSFGVAFTKGLSRLPQMLLGALLIVLIIAAIFVPVGIVAAVTIPLLRHSPAAALIFVPIVMAVVIVLLYVTVRLQLWMAVMFAEDLGGASSLGRSWDLVKGHWWRVTGVGFVSSIVIWILSVAIGISVGLVFGLIGVHGTTPDAMLRRVQLIGAGGELARLLTIPLLTAAWLAIYQDVRLRRDGTDLAARTEALSGG